MPELTRKCHSLTIDREKYTKKQLKKLSINNLVQKIRYYYYATDRLRQIILKERVENTYLRRRVTQLEKRLKVLNKSKHSFVCIDSTIKKRETEKENDNTNKIQK